MAILNIAGLEVPIVVDGTERRNLFIGDRLRASSGNLRTISRAQKNVWNCRTGLLSQADAQQLESILTRAHNLVTSPEMNTDAGSGVVLNFTSETSATVTAAYAIADSAQRITISASTNTGAATVYQTISGFEPGEVVSVSVECKYDSLANAVGTILGAWKDSGGSTTGTFNLSNLTNTGYIRQEIDGQTVPASTVSLRIDFRLDSNSAGASGIAYYRDAQVERGSTALAYTDNSLPITAYGDFIRGGGYSTTALTRSVHPEFLGSQPTNVAGEEFVVLSFRLFEV
jgi:hypothetical protein